MPARGTAIGIQGFLDDGVAFVWRWNSPSLLPNGAAKLGRRVFGGLQAGLTKGGVAPIWVNMGSSRVGSRGLSGSCVWALSLIADWRHCCPVSLPERKIVDWQHC